jgi:hypothetical protein
MGLMFSKALTRLFGKKEMRILMVSRGCGGGVLVLLVLAR